MTISGVYGYYCYSKSTWISKNSFSYTAKISTKDNSVLSTSQTTWYSGNIQPNAVNITYGGNAGTRVELSITSISINKIL